MPKALEISAGGSWAIGMRNAATEVDGLYVRVHLQTGGEKAGELLHIVGKFRHRRPRADVGMEEGHGHAVACGGVCNSEGFVKPDTVFGAGAAGITALYMAMAKARVQTQPQRATIARRR